MAVNKEELAKYVSELGLSEEDQKATLSVLLKSDEAATRFMSGRLMHADYTRKTQELSDQRKQLESAANQQVQAYASKLAEAQKQIERIAADYERESISATTANARLAKVKATYGLTDDEIPPVDAQPVKPQQSQQQVVDFDGRLKQFRDQLMSDLRADMMALPKVTAIQYDIADQHKELTGQRLTRAQILELQDHAMKERIPLEQAWESKYAIPDLRLKKRDDENRSKWQAEWEAEQRTKNSEAALSGVRNPAMPKPLSESPVIGRQYNRAEAPSPEPNRQAAPAPSVPANGGQRLSGAERAAMRFNERRANGVPMGAPDPVK